MAPNSGSLQKQKTRDIGLFRIQFNWILPLYQLEKLDILKWKVNILNKNVRLMNRVERVPCRHLGVETATEATSWNNWQGTASHHQTQLIPEQYQQPPSLSTRHKSSANVKSKTEVNNVYLHSKIFSPN